MAVLDFSPRPSHRRRIVIFCVACAVAGTLSLTYTYMRPPVYQAVARLQIVPGSAEAPPDTSEAKVIIPGEKDTMPFLTEVQVLTSRPVLTEAIDRLGKEGGVPALGEDRVGAVQRMLRAEPVGGTQIVLLSAEGGTPEFLPRLVNTVADVYRQHVAGSYKDTSADKLTQVRDEIADLETQVAAQRKAVEDFGARYNIVSAERDENAALGKLSGLNKSLEEANAKQAAAQGKVQALRAAIAAGQSGIQAKDDPTVADLERRASLLREQWQELQRRFTPQYLAMDKDAQSLRSRLDNLEEQIVQARKAGQQVALAGAQEDLTGAQTAVEQLRQQMIDAQRDAKEFATRLSRYKALESDLTHIEALHRDALDRQAKLKSSEPARAPQIALLEAAVPGREPVRPAYTRDALISVAGSLVFGLFAVWLAEFLAPGEAAPRMILGQSWGGPVLGHAPQQPPVLPRPEMMQLAAPELPPRELADGEIAALLEAAGDEARIAIVALLMGLGVAELVQLRWEHLDRANGVLNLPGDAARAVVLEEPLRGLLAAREPSVSAATIVAGAQGPLDGAEIGRLVLYAAFDAGLERPDEVTPDILRYTYLAFLLRQGIRVADIGRLAGRVPQQELIAYMRFAPPMQRLSFDKIERVMPALRQLAGRAGGGAR
jgi:polysaccharide biosynthesis transport protein